MKHYYLKFGTGDPANYTGLSPTFTIFSINGVTAVTSPGITETPSSSGLYQFTYGPTLSIIFKADGGSVLSGSDRYIVGALDPIQAVDEQIGTLDDSIGSTSTDPGSIIGYLKRAQSFTEGNATFIKSTGVWSVYGKGSSTLLMQKTLTNNTTSAGKS